MHKSTMKPSNHMIKALAGLAASCLLLAGCTNASVETAQGSGDTATPESTVASLTVDPALQAMLPEKVKSSGTLKVATDPTYPPFEFYDTDNKTLIGADPELAQALGQILGVTFELEESSFANIIPSLESGKYDLAMSAMSDRREREKVVTFVTYMKNAGAFLVPSDSSKKPTSLDDLCGLNVAVQSGTTMSDDVAGQVPLCLNTGKEPLNALVFKSQNEVVLALNSSRADVAMVTAGSGAYIVTESSTPFEVTGTYNAGSVLGLAVNKNSVQLADALRAAMQKLIENGTYEGIMSKWGLFKLNSIDESVINGAIS